MFFPIYAGICSVCVCARSAPRFPTLAECALTPFRAVWHRAGAFPHSSPTTKTNRLLLLSPCLLAPSPFILLFCFCLGVKTGSPRGKEPGRGRLLDASAHLMETLWIWKSRLVRQQIGSSNIYIYIWKIYEYNALSITMDLQLFCTIHMLNHVNRKGM